MDDAINDPRVSVQKMLLHAAKDVFAGMKDDDAMVATYLFPSPVSVPGYDNVRLAVTISPITEVVLPLGSLRKLQS